MLKKINGAGSQGKEKSLRAKLWVDGENVVFGDFYLIRILFYNPKILSM